MTNNFLRFPIGEQFNKKVRNLAQVHLSYFGIEQKCSDLVTSVRVELLKIENYSTAVEKIGEFSFLNVFCPLQKRFVISIVRFRQSPPQRLSSQNLCLEKTELKNR